MPAEKLHLDDWEQPEYGLIALHCSLEEYKVAFLINSYLNFHLARWIENDLCLSDGEVKFPVYEWVDEQAQTQWTLIANKAIYTSSKLFQDNGLFREQNYITQKKGVLIPNISKVDFILRSNDRSQVNDPLTKKIKSIPGIEAAYALDFNKLKNSYRLIF